MTSDKQIEANRKNAKKSTGPRSVAGRNRSRRNSRRHGLAAVVETDPLKSNEIQSLAKAISDSGPDQTVGEAPLEVATATFDLQRIRLMKASLFNSMLDTKRTPDALVELDDALRKLERYELRALSRRRRAMRAL